MYVLRPVAGFALLAGIGLGACSSAPTAPYPIDVSRDEQQIARDAVPVVVEAQGPKRVGGEIRQKLPAWIKRIETGSTTNDAGLSNFTVQSLQPIYALSDEDESVFTQFRMNRNGQMEDASAVSNVGLGYRRLLQPDLLVGVNGFYDRDWSELNNRAGADTELRWRALDLGFNYYVGLDDGGRDSEGSHALDGYNIEVATQIPYLPWARAQFSTSEFFQDAEIDDRTTYATSVQLGLMHNLSLSAGVRGDGAIDQVGFVGVSYRLDGNPPKQRRRYLLSKDPIAPVAFEPRDMKGHMMDKVRRIDAIPVSY